MSEQCKHLDTRLRPAYLGQIHPEDTTATLDSIVAALSHEINNSLTPIIGLTSPAMQSCAYSPEVRMILNSIFSAGCRIAETMESLAFLQHPTPTQENDTRFSLDNLLAELIKNENSFRRESISFSNTGVFLQGHYNVFKALISSLIKLAGKEPSSDAAPIYIYTIHPSASRHFLLITGSDKYQDRKKRMPWPAQPMGQSTVPSVDYIISRLLAAQANLDLQIVKEKKGNSYAIDLSTAVNVDE